MELLNKKVLICGNGPSLTPEILNKIESREDFVSLACNRIDLIFDKTPWRPDFYFSFSSNIDKKEWMESAFKSIIGAKQKAFLSKKHEKIYRLFNGIDFRKCLFVKAKEYDRHSAIVPEFVTANFWENPSSSYTATSILFQFAFTNGAREIFLIGQDGYLPRDKNHFSKDYKFDPRNFNKSNKRIIDVHNLIKKEATKRGIKIYNLSNISILKEIYPKGEI